MVKNRTFVSYTIYIDTMKTRHIVLLAIAGLFFVLASCKTAEKCPAYGEKKKYQIEVAY